VPSQLVAGHSPVVMHAAVQQLPVPATPQALLEHITFAVQLMPGPSLLVHIIDAQYCDNEQSPAVEQPHWVPLTQIRLVPPLAHGMQAPPLLPQVELPVPVWHVAPSQQPPLHMSGPAQAGLQKLKPFDEGLPGLQALFVPQFI
jgi:hypothetical protein